MICLILLVCTVCNRIFKKTTPNGKITLYLEKRNFTGGPNQLDPINGLVIVDSEYLRGKKVFCQLSTVYRYGREEDEVMGLKFKKEFVLARGQVAEAGQLSIENLTPTQDRLLKKFPGTAFPFSFKFPVNAPSSVTLQPGKSTTSKSLGVFYSVKCFAGDNNEERALKGSKVSLIVKKLHYCTPDIKSAHLPTSSASKYFSFGSGKVDLIVTLDKEYYYHGEPVGINVEITNTSRKSVKDIKCYVLQNCELTMINSRYSQCVATLETRDGCPIVPGSFFSRKFTLVPIASINKNKFGIALDGYLKGDDVSLASSTFVGEGHSPEDSLGVVVSYAVRIKLNCGILGKDLTTDVPFLLTHPLQGSEEEKKMKKLIATQSIDKFYYESVCNTNDVDGDENALTDITRQKTIESNE